MYYEYDIDSIYVSQDNIALQDNKNIFTAVREAVPIFHQSIGSFPTETRYLFTFENGFEPKNPRCADRGDGCGDFTTI